MTTVDRQSHRRPACCIRPGRCLVPLLAVAVVLAACEEEEALPRSVRVVLTSEASVPQEVNHVTLWVTASRSPDGTRSTCQPVAYQFPLPSPEALPVIVDLLPGDRYNYSFAVRVEWKNRGELVAVQDRMGRWPSSGAEEYQVRLKRGCLDPEPCVPREGPEDYCVEGTCEYRASPGLFDESMIEPGAPSCAANQSTR